MLNKTTDTGSRSTNFCQVCNTLISPTEVSSLKSCRHICVGCEVVLMQCPVCISEQNGVAVCQASVDRTVYNLLETQGSATAEKDCQLSTPGKNVEEKNIKQTLYKHCFLAVWDGVLNCIVAALGLSPSKKNYILHNFQKIILRVGRQTGRTLFPSITANLQPRVTTKVFSGTVVAVGVLVCIFIVCRKTK